MIDFISSIDNGYQRIAVDSDPSSQLKTRSDRVYDYDEAIADLNKAAKLLPDFAYIYYNRGNLLCRSGRMPEAIEDYTRAIELNPSFGEAYYNRGLIQIYLQGYPQGMSRHEQGRRAGRGRRVQGAEDLRPAAGPDPIGTKRRRAQCASARARAVRPTTNY